jgi:Tfp pilus assembly protein PilX
MNIGNLKIGTRLGAGFAIVLLLLVAIAGLGINRMALMQDRMDEITQVNNVELELASDCLAQLDFVDRRSGKEIGGLAYQSAGCEICGSGRQVE